MALPSTGYATAVATNPSSSLTDFSLWIDLSLLPVDWWTACTSTDKTKLRVAIDSSGTELAFDAIAFDTGAKTGFLRAKWDGSLSDSGTQTLRVYPSDSGNSSYAAGDTYGQYAAYASSWKGYWPLQSDFNDRTSNAKNLTATGSPTAGGASGKFGNATDFDGTSQYLTNASPGVSAEPHTLMSWFRCEEASTYIANVICELGNFGDYTGSVLHWANRSSAESKASSPTAADVNANTSTGGSVIAANAWGHVSGVFSDDYRLAYSNAVAGTANTASTTPAFSRLGIGSRARLGLTYFDGQIQDTQLHNVALSAAWIALEYAQTNSNSGFWGTWAWNSGAAPNLLTGKFNGPFQGLVGR